MEQNEVREQPFNQAAVGQSIAAITPAQEDVVIPAPIEEASCPTCAGGAISMPESFVYVLGKIEPRFPTLAAEKEFAQATARQADTAGKTDQQILFAVLSQRENRYLVRKLCWVLNVQGLETYLLRPRDPADFDLLVETLRDEPNPDDIDAVIGVRGPIAPPEMCNGLMVPIVLFDQIYSFSRDSLIRTIPKPDRPEKITDAKFRPIAKNVFDRIIQMTDNSGNADEHRAANYLALRYPNIYAKAAEKFAEDFSLIGVDIRPSSLSGTRNIVEVIFAYADRKTDFGEKFFVRVDVTEEFPFLVTGLLPYFDR